MSDRIGLNRFGVRGPNLSLQRIRRIICRARRRITINGSSLLMFNRFLLFIHVRRRAQRASGNVGKDACLVTSVNRGDQFRFIQPLNPFFNNTRLTSRFLPQHSITTGAYMRRRFPHFVLRGKNNISSTVLPVLIVKYFRPCQNFFKRVGPVVRRPSVLTSTISVIEIRNTSMFLNNRQSSTIVTIRQVVIQQRRTTTIIVLPICRTQNLCDLANRLSALFRLRPLFMLSTSIIWSRSVAPRPPNKVRCKDTFTVSPLLLQSTTNTMRFHLIRSEGVVVALRLRLFLLPRDVLCNL